MSADDLDIDAALTAASRRLVETEIRAVAAARPDLDRDAVAALTEAVDPARFLRDDGTVNRPRLDAWITAHATGRRPSGDMNALLRARMRPPRTTPKTAADINNMFREARAGRR